MEKTSWTENSALDATRRVYDSPTVTYDSAIVTYDGINQTLILPNPTSWTAVEP